MIILPKLPQNPNQPSPEEGTTAQPSVSSEDSFSNYITSASTDLNSESKKSPASKPAKVTENTVEITDPTLVSQQNTAQPPEPEANNVLLQQLNLLSIPVEASETSMESSTDETASEESLEGLAQSLQASDIKSSQITNMSEKKPLSSPQSLLNQSFMSDVKLNSGQAALASTMDTPANDAMPSDSKNTLTAALITTQPAGVKQDSPLLPEGLKTMDLKKVSSQQDLSTLKSKMTDKLASQKTDSLSSTIMSQAAEVGKKITDAVESVIGQSFNSALGEVLQPSQLANLPDKPMELLNQLSHFINGHTTQLMTADPVLNAVTALQTNAVDKEMTKALNPGYEVNVALLPQTLDSIAKQTYDAKIKIYPPELGHVTAKLKIEKNNADLVILAENDRVKSIIESNLAQLRENFKQSDINLTNIQVQVSNSDSKEPNENQKQNQRYNNESALANTLSPNPAEALTPTQQEAPQSSDTLIDTYA